MFLPLLLALVSCTAANLASIGKLADLTVRAVDDVRDAVAECKAVHAEKDKADLCIDAVLEAYGSAVDAGTAGLEELCAEVESTSKVCTR